MVSLVKNIKKLEEFLNEFSRKPKIICISETRTNDKNIHLVALPGYSFYSENFSTKARGVGIYVVDSFYCQEITNLRLNLIGCEDVWIEINLNDKTNLVVGTDYRHPQPKYLKFSQAFYNNLLKLKENKKYVVLKDFNVDHNWLDDSPPLRQLRTRFLLFYLVFLIHVWRVAIIRMDLK